MQQKNINYYVDHINFSTVKFSLISFNKTFFYYIFLNLKKHLYNRWYGRMEELVPSIHPRQVSQGISFFIYNIIIFMIIL